MISSLLRKNFSYLRLLVCVVFACIVIPSVGLLIYSTNTYAERTTATWDADEKNLLFGDKYEPTKFDDVNGEVWAYINNNRPLGNDEIADNWTYYEWKENSDCQDVIAFPPSKTPPQRQTKAYWFQVDTTLTSGCKVVRSGEIWVSVVDHSGPPVDDSEINNYKSVPKCDVQWVGWLICQVSRFIGYAMQGVFWTLEKLMITPPLTTSTGGGQKLYEIWQTFRNLANVILILVFLAIILSQVSNAGISNYGIKKLMPRLIVGAILINTSFFVCSILVDVSNVLGHSLFDILVKIAYPVRPDHLGFSGSAITGILVAAGGVWLYMNILALVPLLISGIFAIFTTIVILIIRQALVIMFVVLSPIAFALNIMPSTQKWFSKWWSNFLTILMIFPMVAAVFGGSQVMAGVVSAGTPAGANDLVKVVFTIFSLAVQIIPFFVVPILIKVSGRLMNRFTGIVNNPSKGLFDRAKNKTGEWADNKEKIRETNALTSGKNGLYTGLKRRSNRKAQVAKEHERQLKDPSSGAYGTFMSSDENRSKIARAVAKNAGNRDDNEPVFATNAINQRQQALEQSLKGAELRLNITDVDAGEAMMDDEEYTRKEVERAAKEGVGKDGRALTESEKAAAIRRLAQEGTLDDIHGLIDQVNGEMSSTKVREALVQGISKNGAAKNAAHLGGAGLQAVSSGASVGQLYQQASRAGAYSDPETLASQSTAALGGLAKYAHTLPEGERQNIRNSREKVLGKKKYSDRTTQAGRGHLDRI